MTANQITVIRVLLTFGVLFVLGGLGPAVNRGIGATVCVVIVGIFVLDAVDGYLARSRNEVSQIGERLDTLADRVIENAFWIYFCARGLLPVWVPIAVMTRGFITDSLRGMRGYPRNAWSHALTRGRFGRAVSGVSKCLAFGSLAGSLVFKGVGVLTSASHLLAFVAVGVCLLRGLPILFPQKNPDV